ncbi:Sensory transduction protein LytR [bioreactor metagenome]|uniref:Sensory transduction protein LytR n=1 Tax=bioreactor metagenome TaxID=1076179 RepID=A0A644T281_9ZZZZ|nr:response regulator transcription factor [Negativicutes bacterium]
MTKLMSIRAMIVDDEEHARNELKYLLEENGDVDIVGQTSNCHDALKVIDTLRPHLVFLDIEMPGMNGLKAAERIVTAEFPPLIVFATAHEEFAAKAFEVDAVDYLLKPFSSKRVARCIKRVRNLLSSSLHVAYLKNPNYHQSKQKLAIENNGKAIIIDIKDITLACCCDGQIAIYANDKIYHSNMTLHDLQKRLEQQAFFRSHRSYLVNIGKIKEVIPWFNGTYNLILEGLPSMEIPVSRQQACSLKRIFDL